MIGVIAKHRAAVGNIEGAASVPADLLTAARQSWDDALNIGRSDGLILRELGVVARLEALRPLPGRSQPACLRRGSLCSPASLRDQGLAFPIP